MLTGQEKWTELMSIIFPNEVKIFFFDNDHIKSRIGENTNCMTQNVKNLISVLKQGCMISISGGKICVINGNISAKNNT